ncbi:unnamed protein product, partial [Miscanthus lutarioriparius]
MESEKIVHVVTSAAPRHAVARAAAPPCCAPEGPPHSLLTAVHEHRDVLTQTAMALTKEAERLDVPFQFNPSCPGSRRWT